ncbi:DUF1045 domain-containing protein [Tateyamaria pelophila]|uniref:DUF1045 domain-containing protein n=1 Tax=Tateyamaria pelophila TaxID=328415 RepID=UPI001CBF9348|nr:DUF1045 domain-containing protein [Tateyamaria pelophila]
MFTRYAIYYTPDIGTPLAEFGANWLGWDSASGQSRRHGQIESLDIDAITKTPRKYGFHGTIKPPFRLADGADPDTLTKALATICNETPPVTLDGLVLARLGRFLALVPVGDAAELATVASTVVQRLDSFRAPADEAELAKRRASRLSPAQDANLVTWGYPYVLDQFRFHMTLTGPLQKDVRAGAYSALQSVVSELELSPYRMTGLTLLGEDCAGMFHQLERFPLLG